MNADAQKEIESDVKKMKTAIKKWHKKKVIPVLLNPYCAPAR